MLTLNEVTQLIAPQIANIKTIKVTNSGTKRGGTIATNTSGLIIHRTGAVTGTVTSGTLTIVLEGGNAGWENALSDQNVDTYYTRAQYTILNSIVRYVTNVNPNVIEDSEI